MLSTPHSCFAVGILSHGNTEKATFIPPIPGTGQTANFKTIKNPNKSSKASGYAANNGEGGKLLAFKLTKKIKVVQYH